MIKIGPVRGHDALCVLLCPLALPLGAADPQDKVALEELSAYETREISSLVLPPFPRMKAASSFVVFMVSTP